MKVKKIKVQNTHGVKADVELEVEGFKVRVAGGSYSSKKGHYPNIGSLHINAVPTRVARTLSIYLCADGRLYLGQKVSGRPATLPVKPLVDKILWFTVEPDAKSLSKASAFTKDYIGISVNRVKAKKDAPPTTLASPPTGDDSEAALYTEEELDAMSDKELQALVERHGRKLKNPQKIVDHLLTLTKEDALVPDMMYDPDDLADEDDDTLAATMAEHKQKFVDRVAAIAYLSSITADGETGSYYPRTSNQPTASLVEV
jgi:hypothetical protein